MSSEQQTTNEVPKATEEAKKMREFALNPLRSTEDMQNGTAKDIPNTKDKKTIDINIYRNLKISIYKPLIAIKLVLFFYYGGASLIPPFLIASMKQRGMSVMELSTMYAIMPVFQSLGSVITGFVVDKIGKSKPVLMVNMLLLIGMTGSITLLPSLKNNDCGLQLVKLKCHEQVHQIIAQSVCDAEAEELTIESCNLSCPETEQCQGALCNVLSGKYHTNFSLTVYVNFSYIFEDKCFYNARSLLLENISYPWCAYSENIDCEIHCLLNRVRDCASESGGRVTLLMVYFTIVILFTTSLSNCYRCLDVATLTLVKEHNSDFGWQRFFSIFGSLIFSPLGGYVVHATANNQGKENYVSALYVFIISTIISFVVVCKMKVQIKSPGENIWNKSLSMAKNPDIISFLLVVFVLGIGWGMTKIFVFWFLKELKAPSELLGLHPAVSGLYGLPFFLTSKWWVKKIGPRKIFLLALLGYAVNAVGHSFVYDAWWSLALEVTIIFTYHLLWVAVVIHSSDIAPEGTTALLISMAGAMHYSIGRGSGSLIGGLLMSNFEDRIAFRVLALLFLVCAALYATYLYIRRTFCVYRKEMKVSGC